MNDIIRNMLTRRSCKNYKSDMVPQELIDQIIEAGLYAPSGNNKQAAIVIAVTDRATRDRLSALNFKYDVKKRKDPFYNAPVVLCVLGDRSCPTCVYDGSLVMENMMLAAHSLGVDSCWIHRAKQVFDDPEGKEILKGLGIEGDFEGIGNCILGYAADGMNRNDLPRKPGRVFRI